MRKLLLPGLLFFSFFCFAQKNIETKWLAIDTLELQGRTESATEIVSEIMDSSWKEGDYTNFVKAKLYYYKFYQINQEYSNKEILRDLNHSIAEIPAPFKNVLLSYKGSFLEQYFRHHRWKIRDRKQVDNPDQLEIETWSVGTLQDSIINSYELSLRNETQHYEIPAENIAGLLVENPLHRKYQPKLYDLLAHRALTYFSDSGNFPSVASADEYSFDDKDLFGKSSAFIRLNFPKSLLKMPEIKVLQIYQSLESLHSKDKNPEAFVFNQLQRLEYVRTFYKGEQENENYSQALDRLSQQYNKESVHALVLFARAMHFYERSTEMDQERVEHPEFLKNAAELCNEIIEDYPNSVTSQNAYRLKAAITAVEIDAKVQDILAPLKPGRIYISYKNLDSVKLKIFRVPESFQQNLTYRNRDSIIRKYSEKEPVLSKMLHLPRAEDHNRHSTESAFPGLDRGNYLLYISGNDSSENEGFSYKFIQVTNLVLAQTRYDKSAMYRAIDRVSGENVSEAKIEIFNENGKVGKTGTTNMDGEFKYILPRNNRRSGIIRVTKDADTLNTKYWAGLYQQRDKQAKMLARTMLYLDRAIYRPGQKVYFKGVLLKNKDEKTTTVPGEYVEVYVDDPNGEEIENFRLKTNKYGSFNGEFILPTTGITGAFLIYTEEDAEGETEFWNSIRDSEAYIYNSISFNVEEYKRPTFEIGFDTIQKTFSLKDTVEISGKVSSFMGASLNSTLMKYEVLREKRVSYWWRESYTENTIIATDSVITDAEGKFFIKFPSAVKTEDLKEDGLIYKYTVKATVTDVSGETRNALTSVKLGNINLLLNLEMQESLRATDSLKPRIQAMNLNDIPVAIAGKLRIYKLKAPERILAHRLWEAPEFSIISEEEFKELFPEEPYKAENDPENWPRGELKYESDFHTDAIYEPAIPMGDDWISGKYMVEVEVSDGNNHVSLQRSFSFIKSEDEYFADNQRFGLEIKNTDFRKDKQLNLLLLTAYKSLNLEVSVFDENKQIFREFVNLNGNKIINIPLETPISETLEIQISGVKNSTAITESRRISVPITTKSLIIETETFRNKIEPGVEESWSFTVTNETNEIPDAELLASMYDASLDQFKVDKWQINAGFTRKYLNFPDFNISNMGEMAPFLNRFPRTMVYRNQQMIFDKLDLFGFYFGSSNSYQYRQYLSRLQDREKSDDLKGNTRGKITDTQGLPLPGVNVVIKGKSKATVTNFDGEFALDAKANDILVVSFLGYGTYEYRVGKTKDLFIVMQEDSSALDEVVVVGYGEQEREEVAGAAFSVSSKLNSQEAQMIQIRGASSAEKAPLYIVDGEIVENIDLSRSDILNMEILDAGQATALYGASAVNGVMLITTKKGLEELKNVEARKNLDETAFFFPDLKLNKNGRLQFSFTSSEALTRWKLRLFGHTNDWSTGHYENTIVTQKELNITPNAPRFLRENDTIIFKSKITNLSGKSMSGTAILQLFDAFTMKPIDSLLGNKSITQHFNLEVSGSAAVTWNLSIPEGVQAVTFKVLAKAGDFTDGEENILPVLTNRMLVKESVAFFVRAGETKNLEFKNLKENNSSTLKHHKYSLEYSSNPAWYAVQSLPYLMEFEHECSEQNFARLYANSLASHIIKAQPKIKAVFEVWEKEGSLNSPLEKNEELKSLVLAETPWLRDAESEAVQKQRISKLFELNKLAKEQAEVLKRLKMMQNSSGAFPWFSGGPNNYFITRHIVAGFGHLAKLGVDIEDSEIIEKAVSYLDKKIIDRKNSYQDMDKVDFYKSTHNLHYLYARSFYMKEFPMTEENREIAENIIEAQKETWIEASIYNKALLMLIFSRNNERESAKDIMISLKESAVKSEDYGMYWKENESGWHYYKATVETQALLIEAFSELEEMEAVEEMKIWLLQNKRTNHWPTTKATTEATYALLMQGEDWLQTEDKTALGLGGSEIPSDKLEETRVEAGTGYRKITWGDDEIKDSFSQISVENKNNTAGYGGAYWQYFEDLDKIKTPTTSPLNIAKELYLNVSGNTGTSLKRISAQTPIKTGDLITVRLVVKSTADMDYIHLKDMRASGFDPTNVLSQYKYQDGTAYYESTKDAATHFFFDSLTKGTYVLEYTVRANNPGNFSNGITTIESMYAPEFSSHTKGIRVKIRDMD